MRWKLVKSWQKTGRSFSILVRGHSRQGTLVDNLKVSSRLAYLHKDAVGLAGGGLNALHGLSRIPSAQMIIVLPRRFRKARLQSPIFR